MLKVMIGVISVLFLSNLALAQTIIPIGSDGTSYNTTGGITTGSDGTSYHTFGGITTGSDGTSCTTIGDITTCN